MNERSKADIARIRKNIVEFDIQMILCRQRIRQAAKNHDENGQHYWQQLLFFFRTLRTAEECVLRTTF